MTSPDSEHLWNEGSSDGESCHGCSSCFWADLAEDFILQIPPSYLPKGRIDHIITKISLLAPNKSVRLLKSQYGCYHSSFKNFLWRLQLKHSKLKQRNMRWYLPAFYSWENGNSLTLFSDLGKMRIKDQHVLLSLYCLYCTVYVSVKGFWRYFSSWFSIYFWKKTKQNPKASPKMPPKPTKLKDHWGKLGIYILTKMSVSEY